MFALYASVRAASPEAGHSRWRAQRDRLFRDHPQSPLAASDPLRHRGLAYWRYDSRWRFELPLIRAIAETRLVIPTGGEEMTTLRRLGCVELPTPVHATVDVWWLEQYGGGVFLPLRDGTAGSTSYGGGRYLLDTAKGADLGGDEDRLRVDLNFLYHPSCAYDSAWQCPLAPSGNTIPLAIEAGERT